MNSGYDGMTFIWTMLLLIEFFKELESGYENSAFIYVEDGSNVGETLYEEPNLSKY